MLTFEVKVNFDRFRQVSKQMPFATALALTRVAQDSQTEIRRELPQRFVIRNSWVQSGIRIQQATKQSLQSIVFDRDDFMTLQETGGTKRPRSGRSIAIPESVRVNKRGIVTQANRPRQLLSRPRTFIATIGSIRGIWQRTSAKKRVPLRLLYVLKSSVPIPARFGFVSTVRKIVRERFARQFQLAFERAIRTAR